MKKLLSILLSVCLVLSLAACASEEKKPSGNEEQSATETLDYPKDNITIIVPYGAGGGNDLLARVLSSVASEGDYFNGKSLIVENKEGGGGVVGANYVANSCAADGYTLMLYSINVVNNSILKGDSIGFSYQDFKPIVGCNDDPLILLVPANSPYNTLEEFFAAAKEKNLMCGTSGFGTGGHNCALSLENKMGITFDYIHADSGSVELTNVMGGHCDFGFFTVSEVASSVKEGQVKALGVLAAERDSFLEDVPTFAEAGYEGWIDGSSRAVACSVDVPDDVYNYLVEEFGRLVSSEEFAESMDEIGMAVHYQTNEEYQEFIEYKAEVMTELAHIIQAAFK